MMHLSFKNRYSKPVWIGFFGTCLTSITGAMLAPFFMIYIYEQLHGNVLLSMAIISLQPLSEIVITIVAGSVTDRYGRKSIILIGLFIQVISMAGFIWAHSAFMLATLYVLNGIGRSLYIPAHRAQIADTTAEKQQSEVFAIINTLYAIGSSVGPALGYIVYAYNPASIFLFESIALFMYFLVVWIKMPETFPLPIQNKHKEYTKTKWYQSIWDDYFVIGFMICSLPISFFYAQTETNYRIYLEDLFPNYLIVLSTLATAKAIITILFQIALTKWSEAFSMRKLIIITYTVYVVAALSYGYFANVVILIIMQLFLTIGESVGLNHFLRFVSKLAPVHKRGRYFAIYGTHWDLSRTIGPVLGGTILLHYGGNILFYFSALLLILGGFAQFFFVRHIERQNAQNKKMERREEEAF
ncbi:MDR family MFS transporter [Microbacteriaceae bacterium 4G12]